MGNHPSSTTPGQEVIGSYVVEKTLGKGSFAEVKLGKHLKTGEKVALKLIDKANMVKGKRRIHLQREIRFLKLLCHPHIGMLYEVVETEKYIVLIMEHASGGELLNYIRRAELKHLKEKEARRIFRQIVSAVDYCHRNNLIHRDIKPENILLDKNLDVKIIDFGFSNMFQEGVLLDSFIGSPHYAAPELLQGLKYSGPEVDMWSLGVLLYVMICGRLPFKDPDMKILYDKIKKGDIVYPDFISSESKSLIGRLLTVDPKARATVSEIARHPWFREGYKDSNLLMLDNSNTSSPIENIDPDLFEELLLYGFDRSEAEHVLKTKEISDQNPIRAIYNLMVDKQLRDRALEAMALENSRRNTGGSMSSLFSRNGSKKGLFSRFSRNRDEKSSIRRAATLPEGTPQGLQKSVLTEPLPLTHAKLKQGSTSTSISVSVSAQSKDAAQKELTTSMESLAVSPQKTGGTVDYRLLKDLETGEMMTISQLEEQVRLKIKGRDSFHDKYMSSREKEVGTDDSVEATAVGSAVPSIKPEHERCSPPRIFVPEDAL